MRCTAARIDAPIDDAPGWLSLQDKS